VASAGIVPFGTFGAGVTDTALINRPSNTRLNLITTGASSGSIQINDTGYYQVTYGVAISTPNTTNWNLAINGTTITYTRLITRATFTLISITVIIPITTPGSTLAIVNNTGATRTLSDNAGGAAPSAYLCIEKVGAIDQ